MRAQRSNPESFRGGSLDCFAALAMTLVEQRSRCNGDLTRGRYGTPPKVHAASGRGATGGRVVHRRSRLKFTNTMWELLKRLRRAAARP
ncbi:hypothetical protein C7U92_06195 [Bradyrhizobium sp. WBOS7]|uniref:Uncharacterized protein n=1 Tax=Bradyrhizobium betae TaxID=244734 RepID=A0AAE9NGH7_9BRAD|nr:hypothetical protein [Bradyrhizobium sp. WBOS2]MDD1569209.1 hypothetical protein [Bradyrhizobium sp. WBOS1]MDD1576328.1 hypothetical protein [Bradyrhizobium sp. WBOS7]MDD1603769.1 hypothetical protein [Bradyrhizobium sp. WBOS16]UUO38011.1 hypothetical protein DCK84_27805 [Bradyrhizobium sp. WBOS01]UUO44177.1 hypothetical protein DCM75_27775 [Bradyrhizobium sp. WBOS02]UUO54584.1 hypothetical protein DCM79_17370 [Bradyrhizobium sp. WBOS07]UUO68585.1 hypothetical protein DCM83_27480 [Bradyrh